MNYRVLDISAYQGEVDFAKGKSDGIWGVMLKATEGERYLSPAFDKNYQKATDSGLYVGAYHYLRASTPAEAVREAHFFLQKVAGKKLTLPLAVDIEAPEQQPIADLAPIAKAFCDEVERNKYYAMIYSTVSWFQTKLASSQLDVFDRWIAQVGVNQPTFNKPYGMWQYTWNAQINGITGLAVMKLDVLDGLDTIKLGVGYKMDGKELKVMPSGADAVAKCEPIYEEFPGWTESTFGLTEWDELPESARQYLSRLSEVAGAPIALVSTGPDREQTILHVNPFAD